MLLVPVDRPVWGIIGGATIVVAVGLFDDLYELEPVVKFIGQLLAIGVAIYFGTRMTRIGVPFTDEITWHLPLVASIFVTGFWMAMIINMVNFIDGLDGLAAGVCGISALTFAIISLATNFPAMGVLAAVLAGATFAFLRFNFHPASIFMGDSGSLFVGFILAATALQTHEKSTTAVALLVPIVALGIPIGDTLLAMTRRTVRGQPMFSSDRGHIHHRLMARGLSHRATVLALYGITVVLSGVAVALFHSDAQQTVAYAGAVVAIAAMLLVTAGYVRFDQTRLLLSDRKNNLAMRAAVRLAGEQLRRAPDPEAIWKVVQDVVPALGANCATLTVVARNGTVRTNEFSWGFDEAPESVLRARFSLLGERPDEGRLELGFTDGRRTVDRDTEIAVELLCEHVQAAVGRIAAKHEEEEPGGRKLLAFRR
jgi:UDP-GlcNAc:undecaprenyl-phosphate GlcNAc-1-phosphate transferase